ncbi:hypothetical protein ACVWWN_005905 [Mycobacterium sp. URHB0021]
MHTLKVGVLDVSGVDGGFTFDVFRRVAYPRTAPGGRRELDQLIGEIASTPLDRRHPLWEMYPVCSYVDQLAISVLTDDVTLDDPPEVIDAMLEAFIEIRTAAGLPAISPLWVRLCHWPRRRADPCPRARKCSCRRRWSIWTRPFISRDNSLDGAPPADAGIRSSSVVASTPSSTG